ncbi:MAG TPA: papain-like cysteine protease family protein [Ramlibacter sp.]|uniref:papain-like cysteine protease family protein n=1 Tax=Ramlibacter sp. TaxID=1917967 RepID=UPI002C719A8D|nr:papain-like cysteine protease family protein [Ramlibacter sp.]HVZ43451.1 papain-like cysteine protease family protein [Ramlibacter sp.]
MASHFLRLASLLRFAALAALAFTLQTTHAAQQCSAPDAHGIVRCEVGLSTAEIQRMTAVQEKSMWCWAASIAMIFRHYGHEVAQAAIVRTSYGTEANLPAATGDVMTRALSRPWVAADGTRFQASVSASDQLARHFAITNDDVVAELAAERPLLVGAMGHAVVLVSLHYERGADGQLRIVSGTVIDPQAGTGGVRALLRGELRPSYIAAIKVDATHPDALTALASNSEGSSVH